MRFACLLFLGSVVTAHGQGIDIILNFFFEKHGDKDVQFYLYNREIPNGVELNVSTVSQISKSGLVKFIIHGWLENRGRQWYNDMTTEYLKKGDYNIIQVDWSVPAMKRYDLSAKYTQAVGATIGKLIVNLYINYGIALRNFQVIGHSLGAHVAGFSGKEVKKLTNSKLPRITALDAAGPLFDGYPLFGVSGLHSTDAAIVDAIHTDGGVFGYKHRIGTVDFYPNGGTALQPGCFTLPEYTDLLNYEEYLDILFCSHGRSTDYYIKSINMRKYVSTKCGSWHNYLSGSCDNNLKDLMGDGYVHIPGATGKFYLRTSLNH